MKKPFNTKNAPEALGPYSQAIITGDFIFTSGQVPLDPKTGEIVGSDATEQARQVFKNLKAIIEEAGSSMDKIIKTTCFIKNMNDFAKVNEVYSEFLGDGNFPARSAVEVARLPKDVLVEIEAIAVK